MIRKCRSVIGYWSIYKTAVYVILAAMLMLIALDQLAPAVLELGGRAE